MGEVFVEDGHGEHDGGLEPNSALRCPNCGSSHVEKFCANCGQKRPEDSDYSLWLLFAAAVGRFVQFDTRLFVSVRELVLRPGQITRDYFDGRRERYLPPFQMFVLANLAAWVLFPRLKIGGFSMQLAQRISLFHEFWNRLLERREALTGLDPVQFAQHVDAEVASTNRLAVLGLVPLFAMGVALIMARRSYRSVQHLVFSVHFYCVHLASVLVAWGLVLGPFLRLLRRHPEWPISGPWLNVLTIPWIQHLFVAPCLLPYLLLATKRSYHLSPREAAVSAVLLTAWAVTLSRGFLDMGYAIIILLA